MVDRIACVHLPALPLQLLLEAHPSWSRRPTTVVTEERPQGRILWLNKAARRQRIQVGMSYTAGLALAPDLHASTVSATTLATAVERIKALLLQYSPAIEASSDDSGVFWLDARGLTRLHGSPRRWAKQVIDSLRHAGYRASLALGCSRFGVYAIAKGHCGIRLLADRDEEQQAVDEIRLDRLGLPRGRR